MNKRVKGMGRTNKEKSENSEKARETEIEEDMKKGKIKRGGEEGS